jgi:hypothetical protein
MQPASYWLDIYRGDTRRLQVQLWDQNDVALDLTGVVAKAEIRDRPGGTVIIPFDCSITLPNIISLTLSAANSHLLPPQGAWDLQLTYASGDVKTPVAGQVQVTADVTDSTVGA